MKETVYLGDMPVEVLKPGTSATAPAVYFDDTDQLNTPRAIKDASNTTVWTWDGDPFGNVTPNQDPSRTGSTFVYNLRFPGQYADQETGRNYNYFRDYGPQIGRYIESDPAGL